MLHALNFEDSFRNILSSHTRVLGPQWALLHHDEEGVLLGCQGPFLEISLSAVTKDRPQLT